MKTWPLVATIALSIAINTTSVTAEPTSIKIVTLMDFKPFIWCDAGIPKGIDVEIVAELFSRVDRAYSIKCIPWKRAISHITSGQADALFSAYKSNERESFAVFLDAPMHMSVFSVFVRKSEDFEFSRIDDLGGKQIGLTLGYSVNPEFDAAKRKGLFRVHESRSTANGIQMLVRGHVNAYINGKHVVLYTARQMGVSDQISPLKNPLHEPRPAYLMFSRAAGFSDKDLLIKSLYLIA